MLAPETALPSVGYGIREFEIIAGLAPKTGYAKIKNREVKAFVGADGRLKISPLEAAIYMRQNADK